jgi:hypothetical protein
MKGGGMAGDTGEEVDDDDSMRLLDDPDEVERVQAALRLADRGEALERALLVLVACLRRMMREEDLDDHDTDWWFCTVAEGLGGFGPRGHDPHRITGAEELGGRPGGGRGVGADRPRGPAGGPRPASRPRRGPGGIQGFLRPAPAREGPFARAIAAIEAQESEPTPS